MACFGINYNRKTIIKEKERILLKIYLGKVYKVYALNYSEIGTFLPTMFINGKWYILNQNAEIALFE